MLLERLSSLMLKTVDEKIHLMKEFKGLDVCHFKEESREI